MEVFHRLPHIAPQQHRAPARYPSALVSPAHERSPVQKWERHAKAVGGSTQSINRPTLRRNAELNVRNRGFTISHASALTYINTLMT